MVPTLDMRALSGDLIYGGPSSGSSVVTVPAGDSLIPYDGGGSGGGGGHLDLGYEAPSSMGTSSDAYAGAGGSSGSGGIGGYGVNGGVGIGGGMGAGAGVDAVVIPVSMQAQVEDWFNALVVAPKGILFEGGPLKASCDADPLPSWGIVDGHV